MKCQEAEAKEMHICLHPSSPPTERKRKKKKRGGGEHTTHQHNKRGKLEQINAALSRRHLIPIIDEDDSALSVCSPC